MSIAQKEIILKAMVDFDISGALQGLSQLGSATEDAEDEISGTAQRSGLSLDKMKDALLLLLHVGEETFYKMADASPSLAAQLQLLSFYFSEMFREIGEAVAPVLEPLVDMVRKLSEWFKKLPTPIKKFIGILALVAVGISKLLPIIGALATVGAGPLAIIAAIIVGLGALYYAFETNLGGIKDWVMNIWNFIKDKISDLKPYWEEFKAAVKSIWEVSKPILERLWTIFKVVFGEMIKRVLANFTTQLKFVFEQFSTIIKLISAIIEGDWKKAWQYFKQYFINIWEYVKNIFKNWGKFFKNIFSKLKDIFKDMGKGILKAILSPIFRLLDKLAPKMAERIRDWLGFSLPKKGPLRKVPQWGRHMGEAYLGGLNKSLEDLPKLLPRSMPTISRPSTPVNRVFNIQVSVNASVNNSADIRSLADTIAERIRTSFEVRSSW